MPSYREQCGFQEFCLTQTSVKAIVFVMYLHLVDGSFARAECFF